MPQRVPTRQRAGNRVRTDVPMRTLAALLFLVACEKSGPVESTPGVTETTAQPEGPTPTRVMPTVTTAPDQLAGELAHAQEPADSPRARRQRERDDMVAMYEDEARRFADLLTVDTRRDLVDLGRRPMPDLGSMIDSGRRNVVMGGGTAAVGSRGGIGDLDGMKVSGPGDMSTTSIGRVTVLPPTTVNTTTLTPDLVMRKVRSVYMAGIKRCYKTSLQQDPAARGKLTIAWKVNEAGRTIDPRVTGFRKDLDDCIAAQMANWRFPAPKTDQGEPAEATFEIGLQMVPE